MTDYNLLFKDMAETSKKHMGSLTSLSMCKMVRNETGDGFKVMYKDDSTLPGWLPRPVFPVVRIYAWDKHFKGRIWTLGLILRNHNSLMANSDLDGIRLGFGAALNNYLQNVVKL